MYSELLLQFSMYSELLLQFSMYDSNVTLFLDNVDV
jgi:hypothetical protein